MNLNQFTVIAEGTPWPSGNYQNLALLAVSEKQVELALGTPLLRGVEEGLGPWAAIGIKLPCGAVIELINYESAPSSGFDLRSDVSFEPNIVLEETLALLAANRSHVLWLGLALEVNKS